jgi:galactofuranosylgalactofuranosylrhamnosyl-N-acetylglucosaminyl-diphospho-decaprenol beta-1,5/1,6-galactofuranosyltransferase
MNAATMEHPTTMQEPQASTLRQKEAGILRYRKVQEIVLGNSPAERELCFKGFTPDNDEQGVTVSDGRLRNQRPGKVSFDSLLNIFFENYWKSQVSYRALRLSLNYAGTPVLSVWRETHDGLGSSHKTLIFSTKLPEQSDDFRVEISTEDDLKISRPGLISFSLEDDRPFELVHGAWEIECAEPRKIGLAITTCTLDYGKMMPSFFAGLEANLADPAVRSNISSVIIVNNGPDTFDAKLQEKFPHVSEKLKVVQIKNVGASGGFTRAVFAAEEDPAITHIAFQDDDAILATGSLAKACALLELSGPRTVIGGQMLDLSRPHILLASGQFFDSSTNELANPVLNYDLLNPAWKQPFLEGHVGQWNGWWLTIFPKDIFRDIGYPVPLFVKWDDVEYGVRASHHNYQTTTFPGVSVWHEAPDMKPITWQIYFNVRNGLIIKTLRSDPYAPNSLNAKQLITEFLENLLTYRYFQARLIIKAMKDYSDGPEVLRKPIRESFATVRNLTKEAPSFSLEKKGQKSRWSKFITLKPSRKSAIHALAWNLWTSVPKHPAERLMGSRFIQWTSFYKADVVYVDDPTMDSAMVYTRDPEMARALTMQFIKQLWTSMRNRNSIRSKWKAMDDSLTSRQSWIDIFSFNEKL